MNLRPFHSPGLHQETGHSSVPLLQKHHRRLDPYPWVTYWPVRMFTLKRLYSFSYSYRYCGAEISYLRPYFNLVVVFGKLKALLDHPTQQRHSKASVANPQASNSFWACRSATFGFESWIVSLFSFASDREDIGDYMKYKKHKELKCGHKKRFLQPDSGRDSTCVVVPGSLSDPLPCALCRYNQVNAISLACSTGVEGCKELVTGWFRQWMNDPTRNP